MFGTINEDEYWERVREERENPRAFRRRYGRYYEYEDEEPEYEDGTLFLDEELDDIEEQRGYPITELYEGDLLEILQELKGIVAETAKWDDAFGCIDYKVRIA